MLCFFIYVSIFILVSNNYIQQISPYISRAFAQQIDLQYNQRMKMIFHQLSVLRKLHIIYFVLFILTITMRCFDDWIFSFFFCCCPSCYANHELNKFLLWNYFERLLRTIFRTHLQTHIQTHIKTLSYNTNWTHISNEFSPYLKLTSVSYESQSQRSDHCWFSQLVSSWIGSFEHNK